LTITGAATLDGGLYVIILGSEPAAGSSYEIMSYASRSGTFSSLSLPAFSDCREVKVRYCSGGVWLIVAGALGDVNYDGIVDGDDTDLVLTNYTQTGCVVAGDANFDGIVNFADLTIVLGNQNDTCN
jgi:hypothetical protein